MLHNYIELKPKVPVLYQGKLHYGRVVTYYYCSVRLRCIKPDSGTHTSLSNMELGNLELPVCDTYEPFLSS